MMARAGLMCGRRYMLSIVGVERPRGRLDRKSFVKNLRRHQCYQSDLIILMWATRCTFDKIRLWRLRLRIQYIIVNDYN